MTKHDTAVRKTPRGGADAAMACPSCLRSLVVSAEDRATCPACARSYHRDDGIWRLLRPGRQTCFSQWMKEYDCIRKHEQRDFRGDPGEYLALPSALSTHPRAAEWAIRRASYRLLMAEVVDPPPLRILDLGAGNCWLSYRLALAGHEPWAIDLRVCDFDGLGAARHYQPALGGLFPRCQAEFDALPFVDDSFDMVVFNASLHYSTDYATTLSAAVRVIKPSGAIVVMDSPVYHDESSGRRMLEEMREHFLRTYGHASDAMPSLGYLTHATMDSLGRRLDLAWRHLTPWYGWRWAVKPWVARVLGRREPAQFGVWIGSRR